MQIISLEIKSNLIKSESYKLLFLDIVAWLRMSLNIMFITMFITAVCVIILAKSDVRFRAGFQYLYYYVLAS